MHKGKDACCASWRDGMGSEYEVTSVRSSRSPLEPGALRSRPSVFGRSRRVRVTALGIFAALVVAAAIVPASALACSKDDTMYLDSFLDATCLQSQTNTTLDAGGGIRLTTNVTPASNAWDTDTDFDTGISFESTPFAPWGTHRE